MPYGSNKHKGCGSLDNGSIFLEFGGNELSTSEAAFSCGVREEAEWSGVAAVEASGPFESRSVHGVLKHAASVCLLWEDRFQPHRKREPVDMQCAYSRRHTDTTRRLVREDGWTLAFCGTGQIAGHMDCCSLLTDALSCCNNDQAVFSPLGGYILLHRK